jgi:hypothetical protein
MMSLIDSAIDLVGAIIILISGGIIIGTLLGIL